jgi:penicillin G amidase
MIKGILIGIALILASTVVGFYLLFSPSYVSSLRFKGEDIRIERDRYGIPHLWAPSRISYFYAMGTVMAEDRLYQIVFRRLVAQGRLSEYLGERTLKLDTLMRDLGL